ncbi:hypothetical protein [Pyrobaculum sp.]|uniref:hypothetical protein n=1 Tax=Pyrobaculum sp. TaxID=2004705 RepID=UPI003D1232F1
MDKRKLELVGELQTGCVGDFCWAVSHPDLATVSCTGESCTVALYKGCVALRIELQGGVPREARVEYIC